MKFKKIFVAILMILVMCITTLYAADIVKAKTKTVKVFLGKVKVSAYSPYSGTATASGKKAKARHTIAVDMHNPIVPMGSKVKIGRITYTVEDVGNLHKYGREFDIFVNSEREANKWGVRKVKVYKIKKVKIKSKKKKRKKKSA